MICFDQSICTDVERARKLEWLETNGLGGFSSSTIVGLNTRRYHGLLTAATKPPVGRVVLLSKMEETLLIDGRHYGLSANQYAGAIYPEGHRYLAEFRLDPFPKFKENVIKSLLDPEGGLKPELAARLRTKLGLPAPTPAAPTDGKAKG